MYKSKYPQFINQLTENHELLLLDEDIQSIDFIVTAHFQQLIEGILDRLDNTCRDAQTDYNFYKSGHDHPRKMGAFGRLQVAKRVIDELKQLHIPKE